MVTNAMAFSVFIETCSIETGETADICALQKLYFPPFLNQQLSRSQEGRVQDTMQVTEKSRHHGLELSSSRLRLRAGLFFILHFPGRRFLTIA